jgi:hypothetical protein
MPTPILAPTNLPRGETGVARHESKEIAMRRFDLLHSN